MKNQEQANNSNNLNNPTVANDPQAQIEFDDLPMSGEQDERVKGGAPGGHVKVFSGADGSLLRSETESSTNWTRVVQQH